MTKRIVNKSIGAGGEQMHRFIKDVIISKLGNDVLDKLDDSAVLNNPGGRIALTTDSYVVDPIFFPGGDIGKIAVCGTVNDLTTSGAKPLALTLSLIIEEGCDLESIERIADSIAATAQAANVNIVTGDTKVVERGKGDKLYINTSGIGLIPDHVNISTHNAQAGDKIIVTGPIGNHEIAMVRARRLTNFDISIESDVAPLNDSIEQLLKRTDKIHAIKDPTRGGLTSALIEISQNSTCAICLSEDAIPIESEVAVVCELLGFDPLYLANEGRYVIVCDPEVECMVLKTFEKDGAKTIGKIISNEKADLILETNLGSHRRLKMLQDIQLPRIC